MAAATTAEVALQLYPAEKAQLDEELGWLASVPEGPRRTLGIELGKATAAAVLKARTGDGWDNEAEYQWHPMGPVRRKLEARFKA